MYVVAVVVSHIQRIGCQRENMYVCMVTHVARVWINLVRLPILLVGQRQGRRQRIEVETLGYEAKPGQAFPPPLSVCAYLVPSAVPSFHLFHKMSLSLSSLEVADDTWYWYTVHSPV